MKKSIRVYGFVALDIALVFVSTVMATFLRFEFNIPQYYYSSISIFSIIAIVAVFLSNYFMGNYKNILTYFGFVELISQLMVSVFSGCILLGFKFWGFPQISGSITIIFAIIYLMFSCVVRGMPRIHRWITTTMGAKNGKTTRVLIIGAGDTGIMLAKNLLEKNNSDMYPVGFIDEDKSLHGDKVAGVTVVGALNEIEAITQRIGVNEIVIAIPSATKRELAHILNKTAPLKIPTRIFRHALDAEKYMTGIDTTIKQVSIEDLLFREPIEVENPLNRELVEGKVVVVTGGVGSIGSEICRQVLRNGCKQLLICDINENGLFDINEELKHEYDGKYVTVLCSMRDINRIDSIFSKYKPELVFHAAAHKHVPMMELNPFEAVKNNVLGTQNLIKTAIKHKANKLILISTDKAVNTTNVMGASKRMCEYLLKAYSGQGCEMVAVRFGNVLESNGSVVPLFKKQIANGGPVTVTHKDMTRYFMTIKEAVSLVLSAGAFAKNSELFVLDMGEPVKIYDLAKTLITLSGKKPDEDIEIKITGLRPGEKLFEELVLTGEKVDSTSHKKIFILHDDEAVKFDVLAKVEELRELCEKNEDEELLRTTLFDIVNASVEK